MRSTRLTLTLALTLLAAPALAGPEGGRAGPFEEAGEAFRRFRAEREIENHMVAAQVRGLFARRPEAPDWTPRTAGKGRLERGPGELPIVYLEGTPEEMGRQHGELLRDEVRALMTYVRCFVGEDELEAARERGRALFLEHCSDDHLREARALADAAGIELDDLLLGQWFTDLYRLTGCSTLAATEDRGQPFLARNLDFPGMGFLERYSVVVVARPAGKRPYVSIGWPGMLGVLSGQNDALALSVMVVHSPEGVRAGTPFTLAFRRALEEAGSVPELEALLRATPITVTNNLMVVGADGAARVLELAPGCIVSRTPDAAGRLVSTNHFVSPPLRERRFTPTYFSSTRRYETVCEAVPAEGPVPLEDAKKALREAAMWPVTLQSMIFLPGAGAVEVAFHYKPASARTPWVRLEAKDLLGAR